MTEKLSFEIDERNVARYFYRSYVLITIVFGVITLGIGLIATIIYAFTFGPALSRKQSAALIYTWRPMHCCRWVSPWPEQSSSGPAGYGSIRSPV